MTTPDPMTVDRLVTMVATALAGLGLRLQKRGSTLYVQWIDHTTWRVSVGRAPYNHDVNWDSKGA